jgi:hypothetical protein
MEAFFRTGGAGQQGAQRQRCCSCRGQQRGPGEHEQPADQVHAPALPGASLHSRCVLRIVGVILLALSNLLTWASTPWCRSTKQVCATYCDFENVGVEQSTYLGQHSLVPLYIAGVCYTNYQIEP